MPWYVFFSLKQKMKCGGSLINKFWILSAAHCFCNSRLTCERVDNKWRPTYNISDYDEIEVNNAGPGAGVGCSYHVTRQAYIGANQNSRDMPEKTGPVWRWRFRILEPIVHYKFMLTTKRGRISYMRKDYDIALLRVDYPIIDEDHGLTVMKGNRFRPSQIMPICLPPSRSFQDTNKPATAVGMGITAEGSVCNNSAGNNNYLLYFVINRNIPSA